MTVDDLKSIFTELKKLGNMKIHVGLPRDAPDIDDDLLTIARVHEYGATIRARNVKHLAIPLCKKARDKSPWAFADLFFIEAGGDLYGVRNKGKDQLEFLYWMPHSVKIPERSFIRASYDNGKDMYVEACKKAVQSTVFDGWTAEKAANYVGGVTVGIVQKYFDQIRPSKSKITLLTSGGNTKPLRQTSRLWRSITYRIEGGEA